MKNPKSWICLFTLLGSFAHYSIAATNPKPKKSRAIGDGPVMPDYYMFNPVVNRFPGIHPDIMEDALLPTPQLAQKRGYKTEVHKVATIDGYILELHRIAGGYKSPAALGKKVVFLQHGFLDSSATWVMSGSDHGLAYLLADQDYDVWMGNARGNFYSRKHLIYNPDGSEEDRKRFWSFSWHEIGVYDLPAMIDYALNRTNQEKLFYVGHSQGTTAFYVMCSHRPEYNAKIKMMHALAPVAFMDHAASPIVKLAELIPKGIQQIASIFGAYELLPSIDIFKILGHELCRDTSPFIVLCESVLFLLTGFNEKNLNATLFPVYMSHSPAGASTNQMIHFVQEGRSGRFCQFDWGSPESNMVKYGSTAPPDYQLKNIATRVILHYSDNDWLAAVSDVERLHAALPNSQLHHISDRWFEHLDFVWGIDTRSILYKPIVDSMQLYDKMYSES